MPSGYLEAILIEGKYDGWGANRNAPVDAAS